MADSATAKKLDGRHERTEQTRLRILAAARDLMLSGNLEPTTTDIAKHAGIATRTLFRHFAEVVRRVGPYAWGCASWRRGCLQLVEFLEVLVELLFFLEAFVGLLSIGYHDVDFLQELALDSPGSSSYVPVS